MLVFTVDQRRSRRGPDLVTDILGDLDDHERWPSVLPFERTSGDEIQAVLDAPDVAIDLALYFVRDGRWSVGLGLGAVRRPLPNSTRAGAGEAFTNARAAVTRAKNDATHVAIEGPDAHAAADAEAVLRLLATVVARRTDGGWQAVDQLARGRTQAEVASELGVTKQAVSQRVRAAGWHVEQQARPVAARLLGQADR